MKSNLSAEIKELQDDLARALSDIKIYKKSIEQARVNTRDQFAMKAMQGFLACSKIHDIGAESFDAAMRATASVSYGMADLMLLERDKS